MHSSYSWKESKRIPGSINSCRHTGDDYAAGAIHWLPPFPFCFLWAWCLDYCIHICPKVHWQSWPAKIHSYANGYKHIATISPDSSEKLSCLIYLFSDRENTRTKGVQSTTTAQKIHRGLPMLAWAAHPLCNLKAFASSTRSEIRTQMFTAVFQSIRRGLEYYHVCHIMSLSEWELIWDCMQGINAIMFYAPQLFSTFGSARRSALLKTVIIGAGESFPYSHSSKLSIWL